jgi:energy-converting hydrogenase Eha subunit H
MICSSVSCFTNYTSSTLASLLQKCYTHMLVQTNEHIGVTFRRANQANIVRKNERKVQRYVTGNCTLAVSITPNRATRIRRNVTLHGNALETELLPVLYHT